jgi:hypothetical protein
VPIVVHMSNNAIALIAVLMEGFIYGGYEVVSIAGFRSYCWIGAAGAIIEIPWYGEHTSPLRFFRSGAVPGSPSGLRSIKATAPIGLGAHAPIGLGAHS